MKNDDYPRDLKMACFELAKQNKNPTHIYSLYIKFSLSQVDLHKDSNRIHSILEMMKIYIYLYKWLCCIFIFTVSTHTQSSIWDVSAWFFHCHHTPSLPLSLSLAHTHTHTRDIHRSRNYSLKKNAFKYILPPEINNNNKELSQQESRCECKHESSCRLSL